MAFRLERGELNGHSATTEPNWGGENEGEGNLRKDPLMGNSMEHTED